MEPALDLLRAENSFLKNRVIREKINGCPGFSRLPDPGKQSVLQFDHGNSLLISVVMDVTVFADLHIHISGKRIYHGRADAVQSSACFVGRPVKFSSRVERRIDKTGR